MFYIEGDLSPLAMHFFKFHYNLDNELESVFRHIGIFQTTDNHGVCQVVSNMSLDLCDWSFIHTSWSLADSG